MKCCGFMLALLAAGLVVVGTATAVEEGGPRLACSTWATLRPTVAGRMRGSWVTRSLWSRRWIEDF